MSSKAVIADDEKMSRLRLKRLITTSFPEIEIVGEAENGIEAKTLIETLRPDLAFLDIEMPGATGIEVAQSTKHTPFLVFITAYNTYAIEAFKTLAIDYILKPITEDQLAVAMDKFKHLSAPRNLKQLLGELKEKINGPTVSRFRITVGDTIKFIPYDQIICFEANQKYTTVFTKDASYITDKTLLDLQTLLPRETFIRIHRKHIVNLNYVLEVKRWFDRKMKVTLTVPLDCELIVSRSYADVINQM